MSTDESVVLCVPCAIDPGLCGWRRRIAGGEEESLKLFEAKERAVKSEVEALRRQLKEAIENPPHG